MDTNINSIEQVLKVIIKEYGYDENNPRLETLIFIILLHICELDKEEIDTLFPITKGKKEHILSYMAKMYLVTKSKQQLLKEIINNSNICDKNKAIENYSKKFCLKMMKLHSNV